ncbi:MAG: sulfite exporter TauE/SafE family protein [Actinobacteria bacterium]|nr:sulfite exporter TauE/SafE family protein [Actinomycetota bacterium]
MRKLLTFALVGFGAQLVDGAMGMGYGVTSTSLLLLAGLTPAVASASVHLAELGTNIASAVTHWKLGNVDWRLVGRLGVPGAIGAFAGATILSRLSTEAAAPVMAAILLVLGAYILIRFALRPPAVASARVSPHGKKLLSPLGLVGGFIDATGGGGWGPVTTTTLVSAGKTSPRTVVGSVDTSEFLVTAFASLGFLIGLGTAGINFGFVGALLVGGLLAAPLAAWLVSRLPAAVLGVGVGGLVIITSLRTLTKSVDLVATNAGILRAVALSAWALAIGIAVVRHRRSSSSPERPEARDDELVTAAS